MEKQKKNIKRIGILIFIVLLLFIGFLIGKGMGIFAEKTYSGYEVTHDYGLMNNSRTTYQAYKEKYIIKVNDDGIMLMDMKGASIWNQAYTMNAPRLMVAGDYIAVGDILGNNVYLFNQNGILNKLYANYPIIDFVVNESGYVSIIQENRNEHYIYIYSHSKGQKHIIEGSTIFEKNGYPLSISLSKDATKFVTSYYYTDGIKTENRITFYNFSSVGQNYIDQIVGAYRIDDTLIPKVIFFDNDTAGAFAEDAFYMYKMQHKPEKLYELPYDKELKSIITSDKYYGFVSQRNEAGMNELKVYNLQGSLKFDIELDFDYKYIEATDEEIILYNEWEARIINLKGTLKWENKFDYAIKQIIPLRKNQYLVVGSNDTKIIKLK